MPFGAIGAIRCHAVPTWIDEGATLRHKVALRKGSYAYSGQAIFVKVGFGHDACWMRSGKLLFKRYILALQAVI